MISIDTLLSTFLWIFFCFTNVFEQVEIGRFFLIFFFYRTTVLSLLCMPKQPSQILAFSGLSEHFSDIGKCNPVSSGFVVVFGLLKNEGRFFFLCLYIPRYSLRRPFLPTSFCAVQPLRDPTVQNGLHFLDQPRPGNRLPLSQRCLKIRYQLSTDALESRVNSNRAN